VWLAALGAWAAVIACGSDRRIVYIDCDVEVPDAIAVADVIEEDAPPDVVPDAPGHNVVKDAGDPDAPWQNAGDTYSATAEDLTFESPDVVYVAGARGVYKSTDVGRVWIPKNTGLLEQTIEGSRSIAADPTSPGRVYYASRYLAGKNYFFVSSDGAESWTALDVSFPSRREYDIQKLRVDPTLGVMIAAKQVKAPFAPVFLVADGAGGYRASVIVDPGDAGSEDYSLPTTFVGDAKDLFYCVFGGAKGPGGIYHSTNGGVDWTESDQGIAAAHKPLLHALARSATDPQTLFVGAAIYPAIPKEPLYKSTDNGAHWDLVGDGMPTDDTGILALQVDPSDAQNVWIGFTYGDVYRSDNGGTSFIRTFARREQFDWSVKFIEFRPGDSRTVFVGRADSLIVTRNGGGQP
jgi:photosystem II stability/assembly factor-like uncharacterized protein